MFIPDRFLSIHDLLALDWLSGCSPANPDSACVINLGDALLKLGTNSWAARSMQAKVTLLSPFLFLCRTPDKTAVGHLVGYQQLQEHPYAVLQPSRGMSLSHLLGILLVLVLCLQVRILVSPPYLAVSDQIHKPRARQSTFFSFFSSGSFCPGYGICIWIRVWKLEGLQWRMSSQYEPLATIYWWDKVPLEIEYQLTIYLNKESEAGGKHWQFGRVFTDFLPAYSSGIICFWKLGSYDFW